MENPWPKFSSALKERKKILFLYLPRSKTKFLLLGFGVVLTLVAVFASSPQAEKDLALTKNLVYLENQGKGKLFLPSVVSEREHPDLNFIQNNSIIGYSPSFLISPQILGVVTEADLEVPKEIQEYIVGQGDNLWSIADKFNISLDTILWANDLNQNSVIKPGQKLIILPVSGVMHLVKSGDTLSEIAKTYKGDTEEVIAFNFLSDEGKIYIGDIIIIPGGEMPPQRPVFTQVPLASSYFILPSQGRVSQGLHWYNAIDIANECYTTPVVAAAEGEIQKTGWGGVTGNFVRILHPNGVVTYYGHLSKILVKTGLKVSQGEIVGYVGATGQASGCHLHFDVRGAKNPLAKYPVGSYLSWQ